MESEIVGRYWLEKHGTYAVDGSYTSTSSYHHGELYYGPDGTLHVLIIFSENPQTAKDIYGYVGTYRVLDDTIVEHHMTVATVPRQVNSVEQRTYSLTGNTLTLGKIFENGERFEAIWHRA